MASPLQDRRSVEAAVLALQQRLSDGDPSDEALRQEAGRAIEELRAAYRKAPQAFTPETIEALRELVELLREP